MSTEILTFAKEYRGYTFDQTLDLFLTALGKVADIASWQIRQAADAVRIYQYQYRTNGSALHYRITLRDRVRPNLLIPLQKPFQSGLYCGKSSALHRVFDAVA